MSEPPRVGEDGEISKWLDWIFSSQIHRRIHRGQHFKSGSWGNLNGSLNFLFVAGGGLEPNWFHRIFCEGAIQVQVYEDPTIGAGSLGTALTAFNSLRSSAVVNTGTLYVNPGIADVGTRIPYGMITGGTNVGNNASGGDASQRIEEVLKVSQQFLISLLTGAALDYEYHIDWYEIAAA